MRTIRIAVLAAFVFAVFLIGACAKVEYQTPVLEGPKHVEQKNYEIGEPQEVDAGGKMMVAKDFWATFITHQKLRALNDFTIEGPDLKHSGDKGDMYNVILTTDVNKQISYYIEIPGVFERYRVTEAGEWKNAKFFAGQSQGAKTPITPDDTRFEHVEITRIHRVDSSKPFTWFEIVFTGTSRDTINLEYLEYAPDSVESPAVQESLTYPIDTEVIRYKSIRIKVHEVKGDSISYTVLED